MDGVERHSQCSGELARELPVSRPRASLGCPPVCLRGQGRKSKGAVGRWGWFECWSVGALLIAEPAGFSPLGTPARSIQAGTERGRGSLMRRTVDVFAALFITAACGVGAVSGFSNWHPAWFGWLEVAAGCGGAWVIWRYVTGQFNDDSC